MVARVGMVGLATGDILVLGRADAEVLAVYVLAAAVYESGIATLAGLLLGVPVLAARGFGAGNRQTLGTIWRQALPYGLLVGGLLCALLQAGETLFLWAGQPPEMAAHAGRIVGLLGIALPLLALFLIHASFLEAINRPGPGMIAVLLANGANLGLNVTLVFGVGPIPALGVTGCALATILTAGLLAGGLGLYVRFGQRDRAALGLTATHGHSGPDSRAGGENRRISPLRWWHATAPLRRPGYAAGLSCVLETGSATALTLIVGVLGTLALAINGVLFQFLLVPFMIALGLATATQVRVGNAWGRRDLNGLRLAGLTGVGLTLLVTGLIALLYLLVPNRLIPLMTTDPAVIAGAVPILSWVALALMFDGSQTVMSLACRGSGDTWVPTGVHLISYWIVLVPVAMLLVLRADHGVAGIMQAVTLAGLVSLLAMSARFVVVARRPLDRDARLEPANP